MACNCPDAEWHYTSRCAGAQRLPAAQPATYQPARPAEPRQNMLACKCPDAEWHHYGCALSVQRHPFTFNA